MIATGKGARRRVEDVKLSRYACYLVAPNADPEKEVVALGQAYFAVQTREQELTQERIAQMDEDQQRLFYREEMARRNRGLAATATGAGVIRPNDFAAFQCTQPTKGSRAPRPSPRRRPSWRARP